MVFLDDKRIVLTYSGFPVRYRLRGDHLVPHRAIRGQTVRRVGNVIQSVQQIALVRNPLQHLIKPELTQLGVVEFGPTAWCRNGRLGPPSQ